MQEINILKEKDLPYFERLEREGKAVILRFDSLEALAAFDFTAYLGSEKKELTMEDVAAWISKEKPAIKELGEKNERLQEEIQLNRNVLEQYMMTKDKGLTGREHVAVMVMADKGMPMEELEEILDPLLSEEERSALIWEKAAKYKLQTEGNEKAEST